MIEGLIEAGYTEEQFWNMTPAQCDRALSGYRRRQRAEHRGHVILAYQTAAFTRSGKKLPDLSRILEKMDRRGDGARRRVMSANEMRANLMALGVAKKLN